MEKNKHRFTTLCNCLALCLFAVAALASSSSTSKKVYDNVDSFVDGWNYGKSLTSNTTDDIQPLEMDSVAAEQPLVAINE